jgi:RNA polymerase sigma-70 factor, ECF subfamily
MKQYPDDQTIIEQIMNGDKQAYTMLVKRYQQKVFQLTMGFLHNSDDAADLAQEVFIKVYQKLSSFKGEAQFSTWLYRIAVNMSINFQRKRKFQSFFRRIENEKESLQIAGENDADQQMMKDEQKKILKTVLDQLPANQRKAIVLSHYDDLSNNELAEVMQLSVKAAESLLFRARAQMQKILKAQQKL